MAYTGFTLSTSGVSDLAARFGAKYVEQQTNLDAPYMAHLRSNKYMKKKKGMMGFVTIKAGGLSSTRFIADGGALPTKGQQRPKQLSYQPRALLSRLGLPRLSVATITGVDDGVDLVLENLQTMAEDVARLRGRASFDASLGSPTANVANGTTSFEVADGTGWRVGMAVAVYNSGGTVRTLATGSVSTEVSPLVVTSVTYSSGATGNATITVESNDVDTQIASTDVFWIPGAKDDAPVTLSDVTAAASLYGHSNTSDDWAGHREDQSGALTLAKMRDLYIGVKHRSRKRPTHVVCNSKRERDYSDLLTGYRRFAPGQTMDAVGGQNLEFEGIPFLIDENCPDSKMFLTQDMDVCVHEFVPFHVEGDGAKAHGLQGLQGALIDQTDFVYDMQAWEACNLRVKRRNGTGELYGIT